MKEDLISCGSRSLAYWRSANAISLAHVLRSRQAADLRDVRYSEVGAWLREISTDFAIISSENFSEANPDLLYEMMAKHCPDHLENMRVIAYVRPHLSRILAAFTQRVKIGAFSQSFKMFTGQLGKTLTIDYTPKFLHWRDRFGDRFTLRPYIRDELADQDVVNDLFGQILGDVPFTRAKTDEVNVGVTLRALSGLKVMQRHLAQVEDKKKFAGRIGQTLANVHLAKGPLNGDKPRIDLATARKLVDRCHVDAKALDAEFFGRPLMQEALQKSLDQAGETPLRLKAVLYFTPRERQSLNALGKRLAELLEMDYETWMMADMESRGQLDLTDTQRREVIGRRPHIDEIDQHLADIAEILRG